MIKFVPILVIFLFSINIALASDISQFVFTTDIQTIKPNEVSEKLTIQAQDASGNSVKVSQTACLELKTNSNTGEFSSSNTSWKSVDNLTMRTGSANRNFYYRDSTAGNYTLTVKAALTSCSGWTMEEWTAKQDITVSQSASTSGVDVPSQSQQQPTTVVDSQSEPEARQEPLKVAENFNPQTTERVFESEPQPQPVAQPQSQLKSVVEPDKKPAKNTRMEIQKPKIEEGFSTSSQLASVSAAGQSAFWGTKKWLILAIFSGVFSAAGLILVRRQGLF